MAAVRPDPELVALRELAEAAARAGGAVARGYFKTDFAVRLKDDRSEVSEADEAAQAEIIAHIRAARPGDTFIGEERLDAQTPRPEFDEGALCWVIDPIDGTRNFVRHIPVFASCVAAMRAGMPVVGAIYDPLRDTLYSGALGEGLRMNGAVVRTAEAQPGARSPSDRVVVAIPSTPRGPTAPLAHAWLERYVCRSLGSTALHMAMVGSGELDAMIADNPRLWDMAAGWVLIKCGGGRIADPDGHELFPRLIAGYHNEVLPFLASAAGSQAALSLD